MALTTSEPARDETDAALDRLHADLRRALSRESAETLDRLIALQPRRRGARGFEDLGSAVVAALTRAAAIEPVGERRDVARALIAALAVDVVTRATAAGVTETIVERTRRWRERLLVFLRDEAPDDYAFPSDYFVKDYRFVTALTLPCGAQVVDLDDGIGPKTALLLSIQTPLGAFQAWRARWFRVHTEGRYLDEFDESGWERCYRDLAELFALHPKIAGMAATSWFYDPQLSTISPRLAYLRETPMGGGARLVRHGTSAFDIESATATSATRRSLYEAGRYQPVCCSILWARRDLIAWAENH